MSATTSTDSRPFTGQPGNRRDRERFANLGPWQQEVVAKIAGRLYDGTRTVARCWALALDAQSDAE